MSLFGKKTTVEDILKGIDTLSPDDKAAVRAKLEGNEPKADEQPAPEATEKESEETPPEQAKADESADNGEKSTEESAEGAESTEQTEEAEQTSEGTSEEQVTEEQTAEETTGADNSATFDAFSARLQVLEESYAKLLEKYEALVEKAEDKPFGSHGPHVPENIGEDGATEDSRIMRSYMAKQTYRK